MIDFIDWMGETRVFIYKPKGHERAREVLKK
jgi:hypothetical protein